MTSDNDASFLAALNPEQRPAAEHSVDGPLRVIAGAGTGKTKTLGRPRRQPHSSTGPTRAQILLLTFTRHGPRAR